MSVPALAFLLPDAALKPYWNNSHPPETHPSGNLLLHLTPQLKPKQKTVSIWMNFPEISIIYEGQLSGTDTGSVHVLKVVDEFHKKNKLKKRTAHGQVISLTSNTITIKSKKGKTATYPITGTKQYYQ